MRDGIFKFAGGYPFGRGKYQIPGGKNIKKALTHEQVGMIANYQAVGEERRARDYWMFSFLCNGINVKDMARLRWKDIDGDRIILIRSKTQRETKSSPRPVVIIITEMIGRIIDRWRATEGSYVFPILHEGVTPEEEHMAIQSTVALINKYMKTITERLEIPAHVTTYTARHSFATILMRSGASTEFISEALAHTNVATTAAYLGGFEDAEKRKWAEKLADFNTTGNE